MMYQTVTTDDGQLSGFRSGLKTMAYLLNIIYSYDYSYCS